jgi:hypothetical protein
MIVVQFVRPLRPLGMCSPPHDSDLETSSHLSLQIRRRRQTAHKFHTNQRCPGTAILSKCVIVCLLIPRSTILWQKKSCIELLIVKCEVLLLNCCFVVDFVFSTDEAFRPEVGINKNMQKSPTTHCCRLIFCCSFCVILCFLGRDPTSLSYQAVHSSRSNMQPGWWQTGFNGFLFYKESIVRIVYGSSN